MMINRAKTISQLRAKITQLKQEKAQLRLFLHEIIEAYYRTVNGSTASKEDQENAEENDEQPF